MMPPLTLVRFSIVDITSKKTLAFAVTKDEADRKFAQLSMEHPQRKLWLKSLPKGTKALLA